MKKVDMSNILAKLVILAILTPFIIVYCKGVRLWWLGEMEMVTGIFSVIMLIVCGCGAIQMAVQLYQQEFRGRWR